MAYLNEDQWSSLFAGLFRNQYQVLVGAGFSLDVRDRENVPLPSGQGLANELVENFALPAAPGEAVDLSRAYEMVASRTSLDGLNRESWLKKRFTRTTPPDWYKHLASLPIQRIWTLNIDDALERSDPNKFKAVTFSDKHKTWGGEVTEVVHLHGFADRPDKGLIFSLSEYRGSIMGPRSYALQFQEALSSGPVIVLGSALTTELDLAQALRARAQGVDNRWPSIVVKPNPSKLDRLEFEAWGLLLVDATAEQFLEAVIKELPAAQRRLAPQLASEKLSGPTAVMFNQQWKRLSPDQGGMQGYRDFLTGDEPRPVDIREGLAIRRDARDRLIQSLITADRPVLLHGLPFSGKSTLAIDIALNFNAGGWQVYDFLGDEKLDVPAALNQLRAEPHTLLVVDNAGLVADGLKNLVDKAGESGQVLHLLCVERTGPASRILRWGSFESIELAHFLSPREMSLFVALVRERDHLNKAWRGLSDAKIAEGLGRSSHQDFASIICETVIGEQFEERVRRDFRSLQNPVSKGAYLLGCVLARATRGAPVGLAAVALGVTGRQIEQLVGDLASMESICTLRDGRIRPRHRRHAELLLEKVVGMGEAFDPLVGLAHAVAPRLDIGAIRRETLDYRISVEILDQEKLALLIGVTRLEEFYSAIERGYSWNSRYWEQRALAAASNRAFASAIRFSSMALSAHRDAFSLNTTASIHFKALWSSHYAMDEADRLFWEAFQYVRESRSRARPDSEYPFVTFFSAAQRMAEQVRSQGGDVSRRLRDEWRNWESAAEHGSAFSDPQGIGKMADFKRNWFATVAPVTPDWERLNPQLD